MAYLNTQPPPLHQTPSTHTSMTPTPTPYIPIQASVGSKQEPRITEIPGSSQTTPPSPPEATETPSELTPDPPSRGRKVVSGTRRAAQNRNAQKAFRQRREKYVKDLEATSAQMEEMKKKMQKLEQENAQLREYTVALQTRLIQLNPDEVFDQDVR